MSVNIVTFHREYNYGAMLQAYGLQEFIKQFDSEVGVYDYIAPEIKSKITIKQRLLNFLCRLNKKDCQIREGNYLHFCQTYLHLNCDLKRNVFVTGSDQVWNPSGAMDENYFLSFVPETAKKISYAASLGVEHIPEEKKEKFKQYIRDFSHISVREECAKECVGELWNKDILVNIDPTLLHDKHFWTQIAKPVANIPENYILVYLMHLPKNINQILKWLKKQTGNDVVVVDGQGAVQGVLTHLVHHDKAVHRAGPQEFVWLMEHAQCVVTSSFHGTAFSLIFEKEFYSVSNSPKSRIANILNICGLTAITEKQLEFTRNSNIDWQKVSDVLNQERSKSRRYFEEAL